MQELTAAWTPASDSCTAAPSGTTLGGPAPYWESFTYDQATGNRLSETQHATSATGSDAVSTYSYPAAGAAQPHAVSSIATAQGGATSTESFGYDASGNATQLGGVTASYDAQGQAASLTAGGSTQSRVYDADGNLLLESDPSSGTTVFLGDTELHVAPGATSASASRTYTANGVPIAERDTTAGVSGSTLYWLGDDVDGTPDVEVNAATGAVTYRYTDPFGNARGSTAPSWSSDRSFLNDPSSTLTGLTQVGARLYDPATGSFTTADPLLDGASFASRNAYAYAGNDPVTDTDPSGECLNANGALDHFTNCAGGQGVAADGAEVHAQKQPGYAQQHENAVIASDTWVYGPGYWSSPAFGKIAADAMTSALANLPRAAPGESLEDQIQMEALNTQMQMFQMNSASELAPEDGGKSRRQVPFGGCHKTLQSTLRRRGLCR